MYCDVHPSPLHLCAWSHEVCTKVAEFMSQRHHNHFDM